MLKCWTFVHQHYITTVERFLTDIFCSRRHPCHGLTTGQDKLRCRASWGTWARVDETEG